MLSSEGLENPLILNQFKPIKVVIDYQPHSTTSQYWHRYLLNFKTDEIEKIVNKLTKLMKYGWYSIFWNNNTVYVVFKNKSFKLKKEQNWQSKDYLKVREYGVNHGVQKEYIDFNDRFEHYKELLKD